MSSIIIIVLPRGIARRIHNLVISIHELTLLLRCFGSRATILIFVFVVDDVSVAICISIVIKVLRIYFNTVYIYNYIYHTVQCHLLYIFFVCVCVHCFNAKKVPKLWQNINNLLMVKKVTYCKLYI